MAEVTITLLPNGPFVVAGPMRLVDSEGAEYQLKGDKIALCRCGGSSNKPFCDGTHRSIDFQAPSKAF
ncbi:MAG: CDGSH iron-sulfur domain-containing protein [Chloroflexota bacterium]